MKISRATLKARQDLPLNKKIEISLDRIRKFIIWCREWNINPYVAFSGGKDSRVLAHLVRLIDPNIPLVFSDTGLEFPEIREFVNTFNNVTIIKPAKSFYKVIKQYGYPVFSKKTSMGLDRYRNTKSEVQRQLRLHGGICPSSGKKQERTIAIKFHYLIDAPFKCSDKCCDYLKKRPFEIYNKKNNAVPFIGTMASDGELRRLEYLKSGCNAFNSKKPKSTPLGFWTEKDIWEYIKLEKLNYASVYDMGYTNTGCIFCLFGIHKEEGKNRFQLLKETHPQKWNYCMDKLGIREIMKYINLPIE